MKETEKLIIKFHKLQVFFRKRTVRPYLGRWFRESVHIFAAALNNLSEATVAGGAQRYRSAKLARIGQLDL